MPHEIHEAPITYLIHRLSSVVQGMPFSKNDGALRIQTLGNTQMLGNTVDATPDVLVRMDYTPGVPYLVTSQPCFILECAFTQSDKDVTQKLHAYVADFPSILAVSKIVIKETPYTTPNDHSDIAREYQVASPHLITVNDWMSQKRKSTAMGPVTHRGFTFINITAIDVHVWVRTTKDPIDVGEFNTSTQAYAHGVSVSSA